MRQCVGKRAKEEEEQQETDRQIYGPATRAGSSSSGSQHCVHVMNG